jgi:hypothetical protein
MPRKRLYFAGGGRILSSERHGHAGAGGEGSSRCDGRGREDVVGDRPGSMRPEWAGRHRRADTNANAVAIAATLETFMTELPLNPYPCNGGNPLISTKRSSKSGGKANTRADMPTDVPCVLCG